MTAVVIALATASIGGIFSSTATDMGTQVRLCSRPSHSHILTSCFISQGILDRYRQINPKLLFSETEVVYAGKTIDLLPKISAVAKDLTTHGLEHAILLPSVKTGNEAHGAALSDIPKGYDLLFFPSSRKARLTVNDLGQHLAFCVFGGARWRPPDL